jgi:hypothetical protein
VKIKSQKDFWSGLAFLVTGLVFAAGAQHYAMGALAQPGPGLMRLALGLLLTLLGALALFKSLTIEVEGGQPLGPIAWKPLAFVVIGVVFFGVTLSRLGLVIALPLLVVLCSMAAEGLRWKEAVLLAVVITLACGALVLWLHLPVPLVPGRRFGA